MFSLNPDRGLNATFKRAGPSGSSVRGNGIHDLQTFNSQGTSYSIIVVPGVQTTREAGTVSEERERRAESCYPMTVLSIFVKPKKTIVHGGSS